MEVTVLWKATSAELSFNHATNSVNQAGKIDVQQHLANS